jgi:hypothetical protein
MKKIKVIIMIAVVAVCMLEVLVYGKAEKGGKKEVAKRVEVEKKEKEMKLLEEKMERGEELNVGDKKKLEEMIREIKEMEDAVYKLKTSKKRKKLEAEKAERERLLSKEEEEERKANDELSKMLLED